MVCVLLYLFHCKKNNQDRLLEWEEGKWNIFPYTNLGAEYERLSSVE